MNSTLADVLKAIRQTVVMHERIAELAKRLEAMEERERQLVDRLTRVETFVDLVRPAVTRATTRKRLSDE